MSFDKHSNFNPKANFSEVKFGENMPVLEVELNEMQQIQTEARADIIRDSMPSGFVTLGEIDYDYCANNNNQIKLKTESIAYVNGYRITIPKDTIIEIGESDKERDDLVFLEVWKEAVNDIDTLTEYGGVDNKDINNHIKDSRYPVATSQRVALKYRIRHVADFNFSKNWANGASSIHPYVGWDSSTSFSPNLYAIGGDETITKPASIGAYKLFRCATFNSDAYPKFSDDNGLWVAGRNESTSLDYFKNASIDGYVYAIPMFRLLRKPNVGLASPFEYKKIHNQLDPKKFAHLVGQENVEKVHSVNIKGKTFKNLVKVANSVATNRNTEVNIPLEPNTKYIAFGNFANSSNPETFALLCLSTVYVPNGVLYNSGDDLYTYTVRNGLGEEIRANKTLNYITFNSGNYPYCHVRSGGGAGGMFSDLMLFKYEDEMEELTLEYFKGVQSLGETNNNSITVENNLLEEGTYVHELQNHILPTHPEVTHVTWGEDVVIPPEVEIELKRGEEVIQTITQLPARLETTGEEKLHVKTMKGRTLVDCLQSTPTSARRKTFNTKSFNDRVLAFCDPLLLKPSTKYLIMVSISNLNTDGLDSINLQCQASSNALFSGNGYINVTSNGTYIEVFTTVSGSFSGALQVKGIGSEWELSDSTQRTLTIDNVMIIEYQEGMENWGLKYFTGMKSVESPSLKVSGANLVDTQLAYVNKKYSNDSCWSIIKTKGNSVTSMASGVTSSSDYRGFGVSIPIYTVKPNTTYVLKSKLRENNVEVTSQMFVYCNSRTWGNAISTGIDKIQFTTPSDCEYLTLGLGYCFLKNGKVIEVYDIELVELDYAGNDYSSQSPTRLKTPKGTVLRSLPNLQDTIDFYSGLITKKIGHKFLCGEEHYVVDSGITQTKTKMRFVYTASSLTDMRTEPYNTGQVLCDRFPTLMDSVPSIYDRWHNNIHIDVVPASIGLDFNTVTDSGQRVNIFKQYIAQNPMNVQYVLVNPIVEKIGLSENDYVGKSKVTYQLAEPLRKVGTYSDFIKGDTLFSNIGVEVLNGSEDWVRNGTNYGFYVNHPNSMPSTPLISPQLPTLNGWEGYARKGIFRGSDAIGLVVSADDLSENSLQGFKNWLKANPVTIYYVKANPMEIPLKEASPLDVDFSLNRQFKRGYENYLKELPNGVKDVVENREVTRRIAKTTIDGSENWIHYGGTTNNTDTNNTMVFMLEASPKLNLRKFGENNYLCNTLNNLEEGVNIPDVEKSGVWLHGSSSYFNFIYLRVFKSWLSTPNVEGLKSWLNNNPLEIFYELQTPTTEELTEENSRYVPYMPLNSYVGSLYVADGINQTKFLTAFSPSEYEVQTYHRYFSNEFNVFEDIKRKKSPYGHKTYLEEVDDKYVEKFIAGLEKHEIEDLRHKVSLTGFDYSQLLQDSFLKLIKGELS